MKGVLYCSLAFNVENSNQVPLCVPLSAKENQCLISKQIELPFNFNIDIPDARARFFFQMTFYIKATNRNYASCNNTACAELKPVIR